MVGIGFFAPLPLALMMPFMAGQSMLMGDAFGKAYQYGKRKISAMSNEEFNKLTPQQLGKEIVTDYSAMIPSLSVAIKQSSAFQSLIIQELATIIRSLPKDIVSGFTGDSVNPITTIQHETTADNIDYGKIAIATLKIMLGPIASNFNIPGFGNASASDGSSNLPDEPLPDTLQQHIDIQKDLLEQTGNYTPPYQVSDEKKIISSKVLSASQDPVYLAWITKLGQQKAIWQTAKNSYKTSEERRKSGKLNSSEQTANYRWQSKLRQTALDATKAIRRLSNDYRDPNNHIRENALRLRREMQTQWGSIT